MYRDESACNTYNYGDSVYWDARYVSEASAGSFDWYQRYSALRPFVTKYFPNTRSQLLMAGCGNAVMSEDMVKDGYENIVNVDISCVAIEMMRRKYEDMPQLKYLQMDVRDMGFFVDDSFDGVIDKGTLDSLMCGTDAPLSASQMLGEVSRILKPGGIYMLITYGDPSVRMPHINRPAYNWKIDLYTIQLIHLTQRDSFHWQCSADELSSKLHSIDKEKFPCFDFFNYNIFHTPLSQKFRARPGFQRPPGSTSSPKSHLSPIPTTEKGFLAADFVLEDPDSHFIYVCTKVGENSELSNSPAFSLTVDI